MLPESTPKLTTNDLLQLIEEAKNAELCRDVEAMRSALQAVWTDTSITPDFQSYGEILNAELLRLCGVFLSLYGKYSLNLKNYQSRAKDLITTSIRLFENNKLPDKAAEAHVMLAFCYWNDGEINECEAILDVVESNFGENKIHPIYIQSCLNRLLIHLWKGDIESARKIIEEISSPIQFCNDFRLQGMFHIQSGIFYLTSKKYEKGIFHLNEAFRLAKRTNNSLYVALALNNLAFLYKETKDFQKAFGYISEAIDEVNKVKNQGFLPHALDTKALIFLDWDKPKNALDTINKSVECFRQGEDYRGLSDALWTKTLCHLRLEKKDDALSCFIELIRIASEHIGEVAVKKFTKNFSDQVYVLHGLDFIAEVNEFKKDRISAALTNAKGKISKAAKILGLKNHQALSAILHKQFSGLLEELGFRRRARRNSVILKKWNEQTEQMPEYWEIIILNLKDKIISFDFEVTFQDYDTYFFDKFFMRSFGVQTSAVVAVAKITKPEPGMVVLGSNENQFFIGKTHYDKWTGIYFVEDTKGNPIPFEIENLLGQPVGFCPASEVENDTIRFSRLSF